MGCGGTGAVLSLSRVSTPGGTCDHPVVGTLRIYTPANPPLGAGATILSSGSTSTPSPFFIYTVSPTLNAGGIFPYVHANLI